MSDQDLSTTPETNHGVRVVCAALGINLALGILYTWSVIGGGAVKEWGWSASDKAWPYAVACLAFCLIMVPAGRMQDKMGPRIVASLGGVLVGVGMIVASFTTTPMGYIIGFGILAGSGIGFAYSSATPPSVKWFPPAKTGLIAGIVVSGFGLASVYAAPLAKWLIEEYQMAGAMRILGVAFLVIVVGLAQLLKAPKKPLFAAKAPAGDATGQIKKENFIPSEIVKTWQFYALWFMCACGSGAGLMIISVAMQLGKSGGGTNLLDILGMTVEVGTILVVSLAIGNGGGRILAGMLSDKFGRKVTLAGFLIFQAVLVFLLTMAQTADSPLNNTWVLMIIIALVGANYGSNLTLFPAFSKDYYGLKNFGVNYGLVFTSWGIGGFMLAKLAGWAKDGMIGERWAGSYDFAFYTSAVLLVLAAVVAFMMKAPHHTEDAPAE